MKTIETIKVRYVVELWSKNVMYMVLQFEIVIRYTFMNLELMF